MTIQWPKHSYSLTIVHNHHKEVYRSVKDYISDAFAYGDEDFASHFAEPLEMIDRCTKTDEMWSITWFPLDDSGPKLVIAPTFEEALQHALRIAK